MAGSVASGDAEDDDGDNNTAENSTLNWPAAALDLGADGAAPLFGACGAISGGYFDPAIALEMASVAALRGDKLRAGNLRRHAAALVQRDDVKSAGRTAAHGSQAWAAYLRGRANGSAGGGLGGGGGKKGRVVVEEEAAASSGVDSSAPAAAEPLNNNPLLLLPRKEEVEAAAPVMAVAAGGSGGGGGSVLG
jgi:hypothetical protein